MAIFPDDPEEQEPEIIFYRAVEDFFANLRGVPHDLSPKDWQLLRTWWREQVPLSAVTTGISEVINRRRQQAANAPIVSLSYCRHAVRCHSQRLAEMRVGEAGAESPAQPVSPALLAAVADLDRQLRQAATRNQEQRPRVTTVITMIAERDLPSSSA